eukprot:449994_1
MEETKHLINSAINNMEKYNKIMLICGISHIIKYYEKNDISGSKSGYNYVKYVINSDMINYSICYQFNASVYGRKSQKTLILWLLEIENMDIDELGNNVSMINLVKYVRMLCIILNCIDSIFRLVLLVKK